MNLMQLKYFDAVCSFGTVSGAAEYLHIAQPSLSSAIKELEAEFGVELFRRHHKGMELTSQGIVLKKMSDELLEKALKTEKIMKDLGIERKVLRLGVPPMIGSLVLPNIYRDFYNRYEDVEIEITEGGRKDLMRNLEDDCLDMVFLSHNTAPSSNLCVMPLTCLETVCCVSEKCKLSKKEYVTPKDLENTPLVLFENSFFQTDEIKRWFEKSGVEPKVLLQTEQLSTLLSIVSNNTAVGFIFKQLTEKRRDIISLPIQTPMYVDVSLVWKKDMYMFSSMKKFKEYASREKLF